MKVTLEIDGKRHRVPTPEPGVLHVELPGHACPACGAAPLRARGVDRRIESHDTYAADAHAVCCEAPIGTIRAQIPTIFGLEEDEAMTRFARGRVYGVDR